MSVVRWILGRLILLIDALTSPRGIKRPAEAQTRLNEQTSTLALYQYQACPFCVRVRRFIRRHSLLIETRDAKNAELGAELLAQGGELKVPCLKIITADGASRWLYESRDIIRYLEQQFVTPVVPHDDSSCESPSA